jgi:hypothetical protein
MTIIQLSQKITQALAPDEVEAKAKNWWQFWK